MNHAPSALSRRRFLTTSGAAALFSPFLLRRLRAATPLNDEIVMALVGCGGQGCGDMRNFLNVKGVRVTAVCDVDSRAAAHAKEMVDKFYGNSDCKVYAHHAELLRHPGLHAIINGTPDHQHAIVGIAAASAGMDIYGEKPFAWGLAEGRELVEAVKHHKRVWQTGCQQRSGGEFRRFRALIQNQTIGKITRVECGTPSGMSIQNHPGNDSQIPAELDWPAWCGPVKPFPYNSQIHPWNWRWHSSFGGGQLMDWVGHHVDIALWTLGLDTTGPVKVEGTGELGNHPFFNTYVKYAYQGTFADGRVVEVRSDFMGTKFTGEKGWIHVDRGRLEASDREMLRNLPADFSQKSPSHFQNFIDCVRSRQLTVAHAEAGHRASSFGQLALTAIDTRQPVLWDPAAEKVLNNPAQAKHPRLGSRTRA